MTTNPNTAEPAKRLVAKAEEIRCKREGTWNPLKMVSETTPEAAALRTSYQVSPEKILDTPTFASAKTPSRLIPPAEPRGPSTEADEIRNQTTLKKRIERLDVVAEGQLEIDGHRYVTAAHLASLLGVSVRTLSRWEVARIGPPKIKIGKLILFELGKLPKWFASRENLGQ